MAFVAPLALAAGVIGTGITAAGAIEQGQATANMANYQAVVASNNATIANQNANYAIQAGEAQAANTSQKGAAAMGKVKAAQAASGVDVNTGSAADVQQGERQTNQLDTETVLNNSELQAYGYRSAATSYTAQAGLEETEAEQAPIGADIGATGSVLSGISGVGLKWSSLGNLGTSST